MKDTILAKADSVISKTVKPITSAISSKAAELTGEQTHESDHPSEHGHESKAAEPKLPYETDKPTAHEGYDHKSEEKIPASAFAEPSEPSQIAAEDKADGQMTGDQGENPQVVITKDDESRKEGKEVRKAAKKARKESKL